MEQCPIIAPEYNDPAGVPISAIFFGGRRATTIPLVTESATGTRRVHGRHLSSETTAAAKGKSACPPRPDGDAAFIGYHAGDYFQH